MQIFDKINGTFRFELSTAAVTGEPYVPVL